MGIVRRRTARCGRRRELRIAVVAVRPELYGSSMIFDNFTPYSHDLKRAFARLRAWIVPLTDQSGVSVITWAHDAAVYLRVPKRQPTNLYLVSS
jgi:hypothetical protein